jgi:uncharacterized protein YbaR (Trm112 family)
LPSSPAPSGPSLQAQPDTIIAAVSTVSPDLLEVLACPKCKQKVELSDDGDSLVCEHCRLRYAIVDGIPVMLIDEAQPL